MTRDVLLTTKPLLHLETRVHTQTHRLSFSLSLTHLQDEYLKCLGQQDSDGKNDKKHEWEQAYDQDDMKQSHYRIPNMH